jgi:hypothetical protein
MEEIQKFSVRARLLVFRLEILLEFEAGST